MFVAILVDNETGRLIKGFVDAAAAYAYQTEKMLTRGTSITVIPLDGHPPIEPTVNMSFNGLTECTADQCRRIIDSALDDVATELGFEPVNFACELAETDDSILEEIAEDVVQVLTEVRQLKEQLTLVNDEVIRGRKSRKKGS